jgi:hypothetical protein
MSSLFEMRCDRGLMWFPSRSIPPAAEHSMSLLFEIRCDRGLMWFPSRYIPPAAEHSMSLLFEMRYDRGLIWFPSRYIPAAAEHSMSLQLLLGCGCSGLQKVVVILACKGSSSDLVRHEPNSIEMRCDKTLNILALRDAM